MQTAFSPANSSVPDVYNQNGPIRDRTLHQVDIEKSTNTIKNHAVSMIWRRSLVEQITGLSRSTIYKRMKEGSFPQAIKVGPNSVRWLACEVQAWIQARVEESRCIAGQGALHE